MNQDQTIRKIFVATASAALGLFLLASSQTAASAGGGFGFGGHVGHFHGLFGHGFAAAHRHGFFARRWRNPWWLGNGAWGQYAGFVPYAPYWPYEANNYAIGPTSTPVVLVQPQPPAALACQRSQEVVTVPSEEGGTRPITVTRCY
jgi:hypothetical protein